MIGDQPFQTLAHPTTRSFWPEYREQERSRLRRWRPRRVVIGPRVEMCLCPGLAVLRWRGGKAVSFGSDAHDPSKSRLASGTLQRWSGRGLQTGRRADGPLAPIDHGRSRLHTAAPASRTAGLAGRYALPAR
jgi:hypothetical protein